jgi:hypothetical protein
MLHRQFGNPGLATQALIRVAKPSYTTGTLGEMAEFLVIFLKMYCKRNGKMVIYKNGKIG